MKRLLGLAFLLGLPACFAVTDLDRFEKPVAQGNGNYVDLQASWSGFENHKNEYVEFRILDASNLIQTRGIFKPMGSPNVTFSVPMGVPKQNAPFRLEIWADHDKTPGYSFKEGVSTTETDHSWRIDLTNALDPTGARYVVNFQHNYAFDDLSTRPANQVGQPVKVTLTDMSAFLGQRIQLRVSDANSGHTVAFYRIPALQKEVVLDVEGMVEGGSRYTASLYLDDGNGGNVRGFTQTLEAGEAGLVLSGSDPLAAGFTEVTDKNAIAAP